MKIKIKGFLKERFSEIIIVAICLVIFRVLFYLGNLDLSYFDVGFDIIIFSFVIYLITSFIFYKKNLAIGDEIERLRTENEHLKAKIITDKKDLQDYFVLWVHQIKTPITAAKLLLEDVSTLKEDKVRTQLIYIEEYTDMVINYLKIMNVDRDMDITEVKLDEVIKLVIRKYSYIFIRNCIKLNYEPIAETVISDSRWLSVLLEQIVSNALKYTKKGSITISYNPKNTTLYIEDTGIGIRSEDFPKIFDKGYSGFNGRLNEKSSGLGLYLAKEISKRLSVTITLESEVGRGSRFGVRFI